MLLLPNRQQQSIKKNLRIELLHTLNPEILILCHSKKLLEIFEKILKKIPKNSESFQEDS